MEINPVSQKEKFIAGLGGFVAIFSIIIITGTVIEISEAPALIASMGAAAVLLFAVPHGQLSQPWPVIAGNGFSALIGVSCGRWIAPPALAASCAVGVSIAVMHQLKCLHPPGGATALIAVIGGDAIHSLGFNFVLFPVLINAVMIVIIAVLFNLAFKWRRYPFALANEPPDSSSAFPSHEDIVGAMREFDSFIDISEEDLVKLFQILSEKQRPPKSRRS